MCAVSVVAILAGAVTAAWSTGDQQLDFGAEISPRAGQLGPAIALDCERAGSIETSCKNAKLQWSRRQRCSFAMRFDVLARELNPVWTLAQADFHGFSFCVFDFPVVAQHASDHPERANTNCSRAVDKGRTIFRVVSDLQKLCDLFFVWIAVSDGDVEVA